MSIENKKYKIGYTSGVFDLFHIGHLNILMMSKKMCEFLIVGVNTDELVRQYKHKTPIIPYDERFSIIEAVRYVDKAVPQTSRDKVKAFEEYQFDVMFMGDDWKNTLLYIEAESELNKRGVSVVYFPYTHNTSSTLLKNVLERIYNASE